MNTDKLCITLNLTDPRGVDVFKRLASISDVVVENYTPRVMPNFGLDYPVLRNLNPGLVMISLPAHGSTGPWKNVPGFAVPNELMSGMAELMGYPDDAPMHSGTGIADPIAGMNGMIAVMFALLQRQTTGVGQYIDLSQVEASTSLLGRRYRGKLNEWRLTHPSRQPSPHRRSARVLPVQRRRSLGQHLGIVR